MAQAAAGIQSRRVLRPVTEHRNADIPCKAHAVIFMSCIENAGLPDTNIYVFIPVQVARLAPQLAFIYYSPPGVPKFRTYW
jgi:hypothetical protein